MIYVLLVFSVAYGYFCHFRQIVALGNQIIALQKRVTELEKHEI